MTRATSAYGSPGELADLPGPYGGREGLTPHPSCWPDPRDPAAVAPSDAPPWSARGPSPASPARTLPRRLKGREYIAVIDEFVKAVMGRWPNAVLQFEASAASCSP